MIAFDVVSALIGAGVAVSSVGVATWVKGLITKAAPMTAAVEAEAAKVVDVAKAEIKKVI
jgi:hypothetical protein